MKQKQWTLEEIKDSETLYRVQDPVIRCTVPLMLVRMIRYHTCTYEPNRSPCYQLPGLVRTLKTVTWHSLLVLFFLKISYFLEIYRDKK